MLEPMYDPIFCTAVYPKEGRDRLIFTFDDSQDPLATNAWRGALPMPQHFEMIGIVAHPVLTGVPCQSESDRREAEAAYGALRENAWFDFYLGSKSYLRRPAAEVLSAKVDPIGIVSLADFCPVRRDDVPMEPPQFQFTPPPEPRRHTHIHIPSLQQIAVYVSQREPLRFRYDLPIRVHLIGLRYREVQ